MRRSFLMQPNASAVRKNPMKGSPRVLTADAKPGIIAFEEEDKDVGLY